MKHTKEPWSYDQPFDKLLIKTEDEEIARLSLSYYGLDNKAHANAKRIVKCVNACSDVENDCLEQGYVKWLQQRIVELELSVMNLEEENARLRVVDNHLVTNGDWEDV